MTSVNHWTVLKEHSLLLKTSVTPSDYSNQKVQNMHNYNLLQCVSLFCMYTDVYVSHPPEDLIMMYVSQLKKAFSKMVGTLLRTIPLMSKFTLAREPEANSSRTTHSLPAHTVQNTILTLVIDSTHRAFTCVSYCTLVAVKIHRNLSPDTLETHKNCSDIRGFLR